MQRNPSSNVLAKRLRQARLALGIPQDKLGALIGLDESCSSARISRYESGVHQPPLPTVQLLAKELKVPLAYLFCEDDLLAEVILKVSNLSESRIVLLLTEISRDHT
jgi:transcriptional regulator with XRE-family HTH domain